MDKDTIVNAVGTSHDIHLLKIDNREDELVTRINSWCTQLVNKVSDATGLADAPMPLVTSRGAVEICPGERILFAVRNGERNKMKDCRIPH